MAYATKQLFNALNSLTCTWVGIHPGRVDVSVLCEVTKDFHPVLSPTCVAEDSQSEKGFEVYLERVGPRLQLASS